MRDPLGQFADRIARNGELAEFLGYLFQCGVCPQEVIDIARERQHYEFAGHLLSKAADAMLGQEHLAKS